jgi:Uma2 family endonuclease
MGEMAIAQDTVWPRHAFTVDEVLRMVASGILDEDAHVELLEGDLVEVSPQGPEHAARHTTLRDLLTVAYAGIGHVRDQCPLVASKISLPEPDLAVIRGGSRDYVARHPTGADAILVVEVAITSQKLDRRKIGIYAAAGVAEYWLIDLPRGTLDRFAAPGPEGYATHLVVGMDDTVQLPEIAAQHRIRDLL